MSRTVDAEDAHAAIELVQYAYFKRVLEKEKKSKRRRASVGSDQEDGEEEENDYEARPTKRTKVCFKISNILTFLTL